MSARVASLSPTVPLFDMREMRIHHVGLLELSADSSLACKFAHTPQLWNSLWDAAVPSAIIVTRVASIKKQRLGEVAEQT